MNSDPGTSKRRHGTQTGQSEIRAIRAPYLPYYSFQNTPNYIKFAFYIVMYIPDPENRIGARRSSLAYGRVSFGLLGRRVGRFRKLRIPESEGV